MNGRQCRKPATFLLAAIAGVAILAAPEALAQDWTTGSDGRTSMLKTPAVYGDGAPDRVNREAPSWGITFGNDLMIPAASFIARDGEQLSYGGTGYIYGPADTDLWAPLDLPNGTLLDGLRLYYYDAAATDMHIWLTTYHGDAGFTDLFTTTTTGTPGYGSLFLPTYITIQLRGDEIPDGVFYVVIVRLPDGTGDHMLRGVRAFYHHQVSPAPANPTFNDVPASDPAFQFIEAMASSGITAGCNAAPPLYCPDNPVTRRQMAVFFAKALGLHWPAL